MPLAAGIKEVATLPVFATGRINDPALAERVLADGQADMIGVVRGQIADPDCAVKAREGRTEEIRYCIACNQNCYGRVGLNKTIGCVQNPSVGCEDDRGRAPPASRRCARSGSWSSAAARPACGRPRSPPCAGTT